MALSSSFSTTSFPSFGRVLISTIALPETHVLFIMDLELSLVRNAPSINADETFTRKWVVHDVGVQLLGLVCAAGIFCHLVFLLHEAHEKVSQTFWQLRCVHRTFEGNIVTFGQVIGQVHFLLNTII